MSKLKMKAEGRKELRKDREDSDKQRQLQFSDREMRC